MTLAMFLSYKGITEDDFNKKSAKEQSEIYAEQNKNNAEYIAELEEEKVNKADLKEALDKVQKEHSEQIAKMLTKADDLVSELKSNFEQGKNVSKSASERIADALKKHENELKAVANGEKQRVAIKVEKAAVDISIANTIDAVGSASQVSVTQSTGFISTIRKRLIKFFTSGVSLGKLLKGDRVMWIEELDEQGEPLIVAEGSGKPQASVRYEEREAVIHTVAVWTKATTRFIENLPSLVNAIKNNLIKRLEIKIEDRLFNGTGGADIIGIISKATAFTGGGLTTDAPSYADVFRALILQVENAYGETTGIFVKPDVLAEMDVEKASDSGVYLLPPFRREDGTFYPSVKLIAAPALNGTATDFIGGDLSVINTLLSDDLTIIIERSGDDLTNNKKTILIERDVVQFVSANDTPVLVKGAIDTALAAITGS